MQKQNRQRSIEITLTTTIEKFKKHSRYKIDKNKKDNIMVTFNGLGA